jgi:pyruvate dehydrogenase E2 component (dihydrolipoyllysine-residue acetyltransferase)
MGITSLIDIVMPQMGEALSEATITQWHKAVGDRIEEGENLLDISTAKVEVEIPSPAGGFIAEILFDENETVPIDTVIARLSLTEEGVATTQAEIKKPLAPTPPVELEKIPAAAKKKVSVKKVDKVDLEALDGNDDLGELEQERIRRHLIKRRSSPLVRHMANDLGLDVSEIEGSGIHGRVTRRDLEHYVLEQQAAVERSHHSATHVEILPPSEELKKGVLKMDTAVGPELEPELLPSQEVNVSAMRRQIADQMVRSVNNIPQAYTVHEMDFTQLEKLRIRYRPVFETQFRARLTPLVFLIRSVADALLTCPYINASWGLDRIILHRNVNIGLAVAIQGGLVVPVLKCVETMSLAGIARGIANLALKARTGKLTPSDMEDATFTITSPGQLGATLGIPIVNRPQGGILHLGAIQKVPAVVSGPDGEDCIAIRQRAMVTLGIDHRLIDGWEADKFMCCIKEHIERSEFGLPI